MEKRDFYSVPTSPATRYGPYGMAYEPPMTPRSAYHDAQSEFEDDLELETRFLGEEDEVWESSQRFTLHRFSSADELYYKENFITPQVQPPPHLQTPGGGGATLERCMSLSSAVPARSPSPSGGLKINPFKRNSFWNDDFDPFMEALENVKKDKKEVRSTLKRTLSMPHTWASNLRASSPPRANPVEGRKSKDTGVTGPPHISEPKGVLFARRTRLVKLGKEKPPRPSSPAHPFRARSESWITSSALEGKTEQIKKFFSSSFSKTNNEDKQPEVVSTRPKPTLRRTLSFRVRSVEVPEIFEKGATLGKNATFPRPMNIFNCLGHYIRKHKQKDKVEDEDEDDD